MNNKRRSITILVIILLALLAVITIASAALLNQKTYLPAVFNVTGTPPAPQPTKTPTATPFPRHFDDCVSRTGKNATIAVPDEVKINGSFFLDDGDEIAVFTPDGSVCAGTTLEPWSGKSVAITAWGDDSQTPEVDGLRDGEVMKYRIWDKSENMEIEVRQTTYSQGTPKYTTDGIYVVKAFTLK